MSNTASSRSLTQDITFGRMTSLQKIGIGVFLLIGLLNLPLFGEADKPLAATPSPRLLTHSWMSLAKWYRLHADDVDVAEAGEGKVLFIGDSIFEGWSSKGAQSWSEYFEPMGAINFGIGGDMTQNVLWRLEHGAVGNLSPEKVVLLIGINNFGHTDENPDQVAVGMHLLVHKLREVFPSSGLLILAVFPSGEFPDNPNREKIRLLNKKTKPLGDMEGVTYLDIGDVFLLEDGRIPVELMSDFLHPTKAGYEIMSQAVLKWIHEMTP